MSERTRWAKRAKQRSANEQVLVDANKSLLKRIAELEAELRLTVTTAYHDEIVAEATKQLVVKDERIAELEDENSKLRGECLRTNHVILSQQAVLETQQEVIDAAHGVLRMTHSGGKPHEVGDRGKRYEITVFDIDKGRRTVIAWQESEPTDKLLRSLETRPGWVLAESRDRRPCDLSHELADWCQCGWSRNE